MSKNKNKIEEVKTPEIKTEPKVEVTEKVLVIDIAFSDKYTGADYKVNDEVTFDIERANELLSDNRKLVHEKVGE